MRQSILYVYILFVALITACSSNSEDGNTASSMVPTGDRADVVRVIDGDTIDVEAEGQEYRVRYIGVDTPERDEPFYEEATKANQQMVSGEQIVLVKDVSETDSYGRLLRYVYLADGMFVNAELIAQGYGLVVTFPPDVAQTDYLTTLQKEARENQRGLWALSEMQALPDGCNTCSKNNYDCRDFNSQVAAQACFDACLEMTGEDIHHLDGGGDGIVCESLP